MDSAIPSALDCLPILGVCRAIVSTVFSGCHRPRFCAVTSYLHQQVVTQPFGQPVAQRNPHQFSVLAHQVARTREPAQQCVLVRVDDVTDALRYDAAC